MATLARIANEMGEPIVSRFEPAEAADLLRRQGFDEIVHFGPEEAVRTYFPGSVEMAQLPSRLIVAKVVQPPVP
jgi:hypothetical protein